MDSWTKVRSNIALAKRRDPDADVTDLKRELRAAVAADYIKRVVNEWPPLTVEQRSDLARLFRGGDAA